MVTGTPTTPWIYWIGPPAGAEAGMAAGIVAAAGAIAAAGSTGSICGNSVGTIGGGALASLFPTPKKPVGTIPRLATRKPAQPTTASARKRSDGLIAEAPPGRC